MATPELEMLFRIYYSDRSPECIEIAEDPDGLGMVELRWKSDVGEPGSRINLNDEQIPQLIESLTRLLEFRKSRAGS